MCSDQIRRYISNLPVGQMFSSTDLLRFGLRAQVDQTTHRLVKSKVIVRVTRGGFLRNCENLVMPTAYEVACFKARAFGKDIARHGGELAEALGYKSGSSHAFTFLVSGRTSSFKFAGLTIELIGTSARKLKLQDTPSGMAVKALWHLGKSACSQEVIARVTNNFRLLNENEISKSAKWAPAWLIELLWKNERLSRQAEQTPAAQSVTGTSGFIVNEQAAVYVASGKGTTLSAAPRTPPLGRHRLWWRVVRTLDQQFVNWGAQNSFGNFGSGLYDNARRRKSREPPEVTVFPEFPTSDRSQRISGCCWSGRSLWLGIRGGGGVCRSADCCSERI